MQDIYVLPEYMTDIDELNRWMKTFMRLTLRQRILSNDASIEAFGKNNFDRYNDMKYHLLSTNTEPVDEEKDDDTDTISSNIITESDIQIPEISGMETYEEWEDNIIRARNAEALGKIIIIDTTDPIKMIKDYDFESFNILETKWHRLRSIQTDKRILSDQTAKSIFGTSNVNLYTILKNYIMSKLEHEANKNYSNSVERDTEEIRKSINAKIIDPYDSYVREATNHFEDETNWALNEYYDIVTKSVYDKAKEDIKPQITPFFTPNEMIQFGIFSGEVNLYSPSPDNDMIGNQTVIEWFKNYQNNNSINEEEWINTLTKLYEGYDNIKDEDELANRKQSILELGWNPEISFNEYLVRTSYYRRDLQSFGFARITDMNTKKVTTFTEGIKDVKVDDKGDIRIKTISDVNTEFFKCHRNLISFEKAGNYESMKDELCKLKYLDNFAVRRMKNKDGKHYKEYADAHARITNDFNKYLKMVTEHDPDFNFSEYYKKSEWYDGEVVISKRLLDFILEILGKILKK